MTPKKQILLNRAIFSQSSFDSSALTVLTTLLHHFTEAGDYDVFVRSTGQRDRRLRLQVLPEGAPTQINIDLAALDKPDEEPGCCQDREDYRLQVNGVAGFYAAQGTGSYNLLINRNDQREKTVFLDSASEIPAGDLFAVTLVRPGAYMAADALSGKFRVTIQVEMPPARTTDNGPDQDTGKMSATDSPSPRYRPDRAVLVTLDKNGFNEKTVNLFAGQSIVFFCQIPARLRVELKQESKSSEKPRGKTLSVKRKNKR